MTNIEIIEGAKEKLVAANIIAADDEIHTYARWRKMGYQVYKGEKAVIALNIWKNIANSKKEDESEEDGKPQPQGRMYMKKAYFFSSKQVFSLT